MWSPKWPKPVLRRKHLLLSRPFFLLLLLLAALLFCPWQPECPAAAVSAAHSSIEPVPQVPIKPIWNRFLILVWPYQTDILTDYPLYQQLGLSGFQIDRGAGQTSKVDFAARNHIPYYAGHVADKGILHLTGENREAVVRKRGLLVRPHSLSDPETLRTLKRHIRMNIGAVRNGPVIAYALDDEISLGAFTTPSDVDVHPASLQRFRKWLTAEYGSIADLNRQWESDFDNFEEVVPTGFEEIRRDLNPTRLLDWNLSSWMDFRRFMDLELSKTVSELVRYANSLDPDTPAGIVGGLAPAPWGGYDYALLSRAVQWMEAYDIHGVNEILRSFWHSPRKSRMVTFFSKKNPKQDAWFLWYYLVHGAQAAIAWPEGWFHSGIDQIAPAVLNNSDTFHKVQGAVSSLLVDPHTRFDPDPIGIYYSHPSVQAGWAMDAIPHGRSWVHRSSSLDNANQTQGILRTVWCKTLEDLGFQYEFISYLDVKESRIRLNDRFRVIILPKTICLSEAEIRHLATFVKNGGVLIADYLCGVLDAHGRYRSSRPLEDIFGIMREGTKGYLDGKGMTEINGEKYQKPFLDRLTHHRGALKFKDITIFERGTGKRAVGGGRSSSKADSRKFPLVCMMNRYGQGMSVYLNLSPIAYGHPSKRLSTYGGHWRKIVGDILAEANLKPRVRIREEGRVVCMIESLFWKNGTRRFLCLVKNPIRDESIGAGSFALQGITGNTVSISLEFDAPVKLINLRTSETVGVGRHFQDSFTPWEAAVYELQ